MRASAAFFVLWASVASGCVLGGGNGYFPHAHGLNSGAPSGYTIGMFSPRPDPWVDLYTELHETAWSNGSPNGYLDLQGFDVAVRAYPFGQHAVTPFIGVGGGQYWVDSREAG